MEKSIITIILLWSVLSGTLFCQGQVNTIQVQTESAINFDADFATQEYLDILTPEQKEKSDAYFEGGYWIILWGFILEVVIAWIFLSLGLSKQIRKIASRAKRKSLQNLLYIILYLFIAFVLAFPFGVYTDFFREHKYGLSNMTFGGWLSEEMTGVILLIVFGGLLIQLLYFAIRRSVKSWWIWGSGVVILFLVFSFFISPLFIDPLFNDYKPLGEGQVKEDILSLARANGVPVENIYQFDASKQSTRVSANVSGIGSTIRVSLNDNLLNKCTPAEIRSVMAHELGHYVLNHVYKLIIYFSLVVFIGFAFVNMLMKRIINKYGERLSIVSLSDISSLPLFVVLFSFYMFIATPVTNSIIRTTESEADIFSLNAAREPDGFAAASMRLSEYRKIDPGKLEEILFFDHPSGRARVSMAMKWKAENLEKKDDNKTK